MTAYRRKNNAGIHRLAVVALVCVLLGDGAGWVAVTGRAPVYYVAPTGSDANPGSSSRPWQTAQHAVDKAPAGARIEMETGTYSAFEVKREGLTVTSAPDAVVSIAGSPADRNVVDIAAPNVTVSDITVAGCVPNSSPPGGSEIGGNANVRVEDGIAGSRITHDTIADSDTTTNNYGLPFGCYGVYVDGPDTAVTHDVIDHNGLGIWVNRYGDGVVISHNQIHDNDVMIRNVPQKVSRDDDYGAIGVDFYRIAGGSGPRAIDNLIYNNFGPSSDYGTDGGGFEIFEASNVTISHNTLYNNDDILESGTLPGGTCANDAFTDNTASGKTPGSQMKGSSIGLVLRCAQNMRVKNNNIGPGNWCVFQVGAGGKFAGDTQDLSITDNSVIQQEHLNC